MVSRGPLHEPSPTAAAAAVEALARRYAAQPDRAVLERLVALCRGMVVARAARLAARLPAHVDAADLVDAGLWGLLQAIATFAPARGERFAAWAELRVRGAMLDELRRADFAPRGLRRRLRLRAAALVRLRLQLQREPTASELAADLGASEADLARLCAPQRVPIDATGGAGDGDGAGNRALALADGSLPPVEDALLRREAIDGIRRALPPQQWRVLELCFLEGLTGREAARRLRVSPSRVSQLRADALLRLRAAFA
ncbi:MAG: sigma-70 family RNA polymerase sigma factor [Planctomycetota bacterium]